MDSLTKAAKSLDIRLDVLQVPRSKLRVEAWENYEARFPGVVPEWYKKLLHDFAFIDVYLELPHWRNQPWGARFWFRSPEDRLFFDMEDDQEIVPNGWFPFAEEADANFWAMSAHATEDSPIVLISHTDGGANSEHGVIYAAHNLSHLLATAAVSSARKEHLTPDGFVDQSKAGYRLWGQADTHLRTIGVEDAKSLLGR
jgi:hypothetical protein